MKVSVQDLAVKYHDYETELLNKFKLFNSLQFILYEDELGVRDRCAIISRSHAMITNHHYSTRPTPHLIFSKTNHVKPATFHHNKNSQKQSEKLSK